MGCNCGKDGESGEGCKSGKSRMEKSKEKYFNKVSSNHSLHILIAYFWGQLLSYMNLDRMELNCASLFHLSKTPWPGKTSDFEIVY